MSHVTILLCCKMGNPASCHKRKVSQRSQSHHRILLDHWGMCWFNMLPCNCVSTIIYEPDWEAIEGLLRPTFYLSLLPLVCLNVKMLPNDLFTILLSRLLHNPSFLVFMLSRCFTWLYSCCMFGNNQQLYIHTHFLEGIVDYVGISKNTSFCLNFIDKIYQRP